MNDALGQRMKENYEDRTRIMLPRRTYTIVRVDGKAFHTFTAGLKKPFDEDLNNAMNVTTKLMCTEMQGSRLAYHQSDEISILLADFDKPTTEAWFGGNLQKIASVSASMATAFFTEYFKKRGRGFPMFDARAFTIPDPIEVENYFIWRQQDAARNSIQSVAQSLYSHSQLQGKDTNELQEMIFRAGTNWNDLPAFMKRGTPVIWTEEHGWLSCLYENNPVFTEDRDFLRNRIPRFELV